MPPNSNIVSSKSKTGPEIIYRSSNTNNNNAQQAIIPAGMKLVVLVNKGSASAAEIVSGAVQDLDAGVVVGASRTYGKGMIYRWIIHRHERFRWGSCLLMVVYLSFWVEIEFMMMCCDVGLGLVQKIVPLPYDTALKYTIGKIIE